MTKSRFQAMLAVLKRFSARGHDLKNMTVYQDWHQGDVNRITIDIQFLDHYDTAYGDTIPFYNGDSYVYEWEGLQFAPVAF